MAEYRYKDALISYQVIGEGTPVLFIHGWGVDHHLLSGCFEPAFDRIMKDGNTKIGYQRVYIDLPGMGDSVPGEAIKNADDILSILINFINDKLKDKQFIIVGQSFGGYLARGLANRLGSSIIKGLILLCPLVIPGYRKGRTELLSVKEKEEAFLGTLSDQDRENFEFLNVKLTEQVWKLYRDQVQIGINKKNSDYLDHVLDGSCSFDVDDLHVPFPNPCLIITGKQDTEVGYKDQFQLLKNYPEACYITWNRAGHNLQIEQPELLQHVIIDWFMDNWHK